MLDEQYVRQIILSNIRKMRNQKGVTQKEAAQYLGVDRSTYNKWECNGIMNVYILYELAKYFQCHIEDLLVGAFDDAMTLKE